MTVEAQSLIAGSWRDGDGRAIERRNPARPTVDVVSTVRPLEAKSVSEAVRAAEAERPSWSTTSILERAAVLREAAARIRDSAESLSAEMTREEGKPLGEAAGEVERAARIFEYFAAEGERPQGTIFGSPRADEAIHTVYSPLGIVAVVTPWNFPFAIPAWKIAPALIFGNCVIWKPASVVPLSAHRLMSCLLSAGLPAGAMSLLLGPGAVGEGLVSDPGIDGVSFTGSTPVGRQLIAKAGELALPIQAEMGGSNVAIVDRSASIGEAADAIIAGAMGSTGQKCTATSRIVVERPVADRLLAELEGRIAGVVVGDGLRDETDIGPVISGAARDEAGERIEDALEDGAELVARSSLPDEPELEEGYFVAPTLLRLEHGQAAIWREEVFAPVASVIVADDFDGALELANDSPFGLAASVFSNDYRNIDRAIRGLEAGVVHVNSETTGAEPHVPFGGWKESGFGPREQGAAARHFYTKGKTVYVRPGQR